MSRIYRIILTALITFCIAIPNSYATTSKKHKSSAHNKKSKHSRIRTKPHSDDYMDGVASCYATWFVGRKTSSGDKFVMDRYTGAHPTLPMRTKLKVTNVRNGKVVYIEVNDRMAKSSGHVIDLPTRSAEALGMKCPTLTIAHLEILDNDTYNSLLKGQISQSLILGNPLFTDEQKLEIANQFANQVTIKESVESGLVQSESSQMLDKNDESN